MASIDRPRTPCWHCKHMLMVDARSGIVQCALAISNGTPYHTSGGSGCERWEREPGIDDDDWDPPGRPRIAPYVPEPPAAPRPRGRGQDGWWNEPRRPRRPQVAIAPAAIALPQRDAFGDMFNWDDE